MGKNERQPQNLGREGLAMLLYGHSCPVGYRCQTNDCIECLHAYMQGRTENNGKSKEK